MIRIRFAAALLAATAFIPAGVAAQALPSPRVQTPPANDNSDRAASTGYVDAAAQLLLNAIGGKAPTANPTFTGAATMPKVVITGPDSTGDVSGMSATPSGSAGAGTIARLFADRLPLAGGVLTGPLVSNSTVRIGQDVGAASRLLAADTTTADPTGRPSAFFFRQENYKNDTNTFHLPFVMQLNSDGTGPRQTLTVQSNYNNHTGSDFLVGAQFRSDTVTGSGFSIPIAAQCNVVSPAPSTCHAAELAVEGSGPLTRNVGLHLINAHTNTTTVPVVSHGILLNRVAGPGWKTGLMFGLEQLPVGTGGALIDTMTSRVSLRAGIDLSKASPGTDGTILLPVGGSVKFGSGSGGIGGRIESVTGTGGGRLAFGDGFTFLDFGNQLQNRFGPDGYYTSSGIAAPNLATSGKAKGTLCVNTSGQFYVKTTSGACL